MVFSIKLESFTKVLYIILYLFNFYAEFVTRLFYIILNFSSMKLIGYIVCRVVSIKYQCPVMSVSSKKCTF